MAPYSRAAQPAARSEFRFGPGALTMFAFLAFAALITIVSDTEAADIAGVMGVFVGSIISGWLFLRNAKLLGGRERLAWSLIGAGILSGAAGVLSVAAVFVVVGDAPAFGWTDLFFFGAYALMIAGVAILPHTQGSPLQRWRMVLDGLIGAVSVGALLWVFFLSDLMYDLGGLSMVARVIGGAYPFLDLAVLTVAILVLLRRSAYRFDVRLVLFTLGVVAQVFGDVAFLASARAGSFEQAEPLYVVNLLGLSAFFATAYLLGRSSPTREYADRNPPLWTVAAPYVPAVGMLAVFVVNTYRTTHETVSLVLLSATVLVGLLVIARQGVAIVENRRYIEQQRNTLVSTISHELRTPLTAIVGFVELLEEDDGSIGPAEQKGMLDIVHKQADYMSRIVSDLIMLARDTGSDIELQVEPVSMIELATESIHASGVSIQTVIVECPPNLTGFVDPARLQQVLVNLLVNASRYGGSQRILRIETRGSDLVLEVHDDGPGIPRRYEVRVWERFERGPNRLNASVPGSGIGLAIVQAIAKAHGGSATYRTSEDLGGACFAVALPGRGSIAEEFRSDEETLRSLPIRPMA
ncbi:MAG: ATP-binding protein [Acidimicrobiia bacterium]